MTKKRELIIRNEKISYNELKSRIELFSKENVKPLVYMTGNFIYSNSKKEMDFLDFTGSGLAKVFTFCGYQHFPQNSIKKICGIDVDKKSFVHDNIFSNYKSKIKSL
jgi:hypothetical protein